MRTWSRIAQTRAPVAQKAPDTALAAAFRKAAPARRTGARLDQLAMLRLGMGAQPPASLFAGAMKALEEAD